MGKRIIYAIAPVVDRAGMGGGEQQSWLDRLGSNDLSLRAAFLERGPTSVDNELDDALAAPLVVERALALAECSDMAGIVINCMCDTGVRALRRALAVPVIGVAETAFHFAASLGHRFGIVDVAGDTRAMVESQVMCHGLGGTFAGLRGTDIEVEKIAHDARTMAQLNAAALALVEEDHADVIVLGCTGFFGLAGAVREFLLVKGHDVPVVDPFRIAVRTMLVMVAEGHCHSKRAFPTPRRKEMSGYALPQFYDQDAAGRSS